MSMYRTNHFTRSSFLASVSLVGLLASAVMVNAQTALYGLNVPSAGVVTFGQVNPSTGAFTTISTLPSGLTLPLGSKVNNSIVGENYFLANSSNTLAVTNGGGARFLGASDTILGFDTARNLLIASTVNASGNHLVTINPVTATRTALSSSYAPQAQLFATGANAVNSIDREMYRLSGTTLLVTSLDTGALLRSVALSRSVVGNLAWDAVNGKLYDFASVSIGDARLVSINTGTGVVTTISSANAVPDGFANAGRSLSVGDGVMYVQSSGGKYDVIDLQTGAFLRSITSPASSIFSQDQVVLGGTADSTFGFDITNTAAVLYKVGSGTVFLTGANTYAGTTTISAGTLQIGNGGSTGTIGTGAVTNNGNLTFNRSDNMTVANDISGTGALIKTGTGTLLLTGNSSGFTGTTSVNGGKLQVGNASTPGTTLGGTVNVGSGGTLGGNGTLTGSVTNAGSTTPGSSIGTLTVGGNYTFASGASLEQEVAANGTADRLIVGGTVTIAGNTAMQVVPTEAATNFGRVTSYTVISSGGAINGSFTNVTSASSILTPFVGYSGNAVTLTLVRNDISLATFATTANQSGVATALNAAPASALYAGVAPQADSQLPATFDSLSGEVHATLTDAMLYDGGWLSDAVQSRGDAGEGVHLWGSEEYRSSDLDATTNTGAAHSALMGAAAGVDFPLMDGVRVGAVMGYSHGTVRVDSRASDARLNSFLLGGYASFRDGELGVDAVVNGGWNNIGTFRLATPGGIRQAETADYNATSLNAFVEARYRFDLGGLSFSPFVNLNSVSVEKDAFTEAGGSAALHGAATDHSVLFTNFGGRFETSYDIRDGKLAPWLSMGWEHATDTLSASQAMAFASGPSFNVLGAPISRDAFALQAGLGLALDGVNLNLLYAGRMGEASNQNAVRFNLQIPL